MKNWKLVAKAYDRDIPEEELSLITPPLEALEAAFRPLVKTIPHAIEPDVTFRCHKEDAP